MNDSPVPPVRASLPAIACELSALNEDQRRRRETLAESLRDGILEVTDLPTGYAFHPNRNATTVRQVEDLSGGEGVRAFIAAQFGIGGRRP